MIKFLIHSLNLIIKIGKKIRSALKRRRLPLLHLESLNNFSSIRNYDTIDINGWVCSDFDTISSIKLQVNDSKTYIKIGDIRTRHDVISAYNCNHALGFYIILNEYILNKFFNKILILGNVGNSKCVNLSVFYIFNLSKNPFYLNKKMYTLLFSALVKAWRMFKRGDFPNSFAEAKLKFNRHKLNFNHGIHNYDTSDYELVSVDPYKQYILNNNLASNLINLLDIDCEHRVKISIVVPVFNTPENMLIEMIKSVENQVYENWELYLVDDASTLTHVRHILNQYKCKDARIKVIYRSENGHISNATNTGLFASTGDYVALLDHDDLLSVDALYHVANCINSHPNSKWIYTDEDKIDMYGNRFDPQFKGCWNPEMAITHNYTHHLSVISRDVILKVGGFRHEFNGAQDLDLFLRVAEIVDANDIFHIPHVCYHWRSHDASTASHGGQKKYIFDSAKRAIEEAVHRRNLNCEVFLPKLMELNNLCLHQLSWKVTITAENAVTIIIPNKNNSLLLKKCIESLRNTIKSDYVKLLIIDDGSTEQETLDLLSKYEEEGIFSCKVLHHIGDNAFNYSKLINTASLYVETPYVLHLNNDIVAIHEFWLEDMLGWLSVTGVGVVGSRLLYPDLTVQHAGVVIGPHGGLADHIFKGDKSDEVGSLALQHAARNVSAVTGACLLTKLDLFKRINGFDENKFAVEFNDVDYCLRVRQLGLRCVYTPQATLIHKTSATRGKSYNPIEHLNFLDTYEKFIDPYFNVNLNIDDMSISVDPLYNSYGLVVKNLNVFYFTHELSLTGAPLLALDNVRTLVTIFGMRVTLITSVDGILRSRFEELGVSVININLDIYNVNKIDFNSILLNLEKSIELKRPSLLIANTLLNFWVADIGVKFNIPTVWQIHESINPHVFATSISDEILNSAFQDSFTRFTKIVFQSKTTRVIFESRNIKNNFLTLSGCLSNQELLEFKARNDINLLKHKYNYNSDCIIVSNIGTTCERKGQLIFIEAINKLIESNSIDINKIKFLVVGAVNGAYLEEMKNLIKRYNITNIEILYEMEDILEIYAITDIFVCSSNNESFPRVILHAMSFGIPIVSTNVNGISEMLDTNENSILVEPKNSEGIADGIKFYLNSAESRLNHGCKANAKFRRLFSAEKCNFKYRSLLINSICLS